MHCQCQLKRIVTKHIPKPALAGMSRRAFLKATSFFGAAACCGVTGRMLGGPVAGVEGPGDLPKGKAPPAMPLAHFPSRLHAFVWRNWPLVPVERLAKVVGTTPPRVRRLAKAMGLRRQPKITPELESRWYITVIRRNWHLLPYEQLLGLLGWTPAQLAYTLREDDFLYIKLGNLKPDCAALRYEPPTDAIREKERQLKAILQAELPRANHKPEEPLFGFLSELSRVSARPKRAEPQTSLKFCYSYFALYGDPLLDNAVDSFPPGYLARLAETGVNGVWLHAVLYKLAPFPWEPGLSAGYQGRLRNLRTLVERLSKQGLKVFLYMNEPRAMPFRFFERNRALKGAVEGDHAALCTSLPEVREYLARSIETVCRAVPDIGGFFTITASENFTHCWSHGGGGACPRCRERPAAEVVAEASGAIWEGIRAADSPAKLIVWDWGWDDRWAPEAIRKLPDGVSFMSVSEWRLPIERGGVKTEVGEYSISAVGPGPRATAHWKIARERGLSIVAKIQAGNTWELSTVPYIPALSNVARHVENLRKAGVKDLMLGWTLGGFPSPNLEVAGEVLAGGSAEDAMKKVATRRFGDDLAPKVIQAWTRFSQAFSEFPYHGGVVYNAPQQVGPANLLWFEPTGYSSTMVGFPYDDLRGWCAVYPPEVFIAQFEKVAGGFESALQDLRRESAPLWKREGRAHRKEFQRECAVAEAAGIHFRSVANQARFILARNAAATAQGAERVVQRAAMRNLIQAEIGLARRLHSLQVKDSRLGYEASNHYFFIPADLGEKVLNCHHLLAELDLQAS